MLNTREALCVGVAACLTAVCGTQTALATNDIEAIFTKDSTDASSVVPGALDLNGDPVMTNFRAIESLILSPDGSRWMIKGRTQLGSDLENVMVIGAGTRGTMFLQEGQPVPDGAPGEIIDFFGSGLGTFNEFNEFAMTLRARGGSQATFQKVIVYTGGLFPSPGDFELVAQRGDPYDGLVDNPPGAAGDEAIGNSIGSMHILNDGTLGAQDPTIENISALLRPALFYRDPGPGQNFTAFQQRGVDTVTGLGGLGIELWKTMSTNAFYTTPDGSRWVAKGQVDRPTSMDGVLVVDGEIVIQEGMPIPGTSITPGGSFDGITTFHLASNGDWYARGLNSAGGAWVVRNGTVIAETGDEITPGAGEHWTSFSLFTGNGVGDWILIGNTDNADPARDTVMVLNGDEVLVREGDPVTISGVKDAAYIGRANLTASAFTGDSTIANNGDIYFMANLRTEEDGGDDLNSNPSFGTPQAFLVLNRQGVLGDLNGDNVVDGADLAILLANWGPCPPSPQPCPANLNGDGIVNGADLAILLSNWTLRRRGSLRRNAQRRDERHRTAPVRKRHARLDLLKNAQRRDPHRAAAYF